MVSCPLLRTIAGGLRPSTESSSRKQQVPIIWRISKMAKYQMLVSECVCVLKMRLRTTISKEMRQVTTRVRLSRVAAGAATCSNRRRRRRRRRIGMTQQPLKGINLLLSAYLLLEASKCSKLIRASAAILFSSVHRQLERSGRLLRIRGTQINTAGASLHLIVVVVGLGWFAGALPTTS